MHRPRPKIRFRFWRRQLTYVALAVVCFTIPIVVLLATRPKQSSAAWFNTAYGYRQKMTTSNVSGTTLTNYQVRLVVDTTTLIANGKMQSDCDDIRITDSNGKLLPYWIESGTASGCGSTTTSIWTKIPSLPTSGGVVYLYYGNAGATNAQRGDQVFIEYDLSRFTEIDPNNRFTITPTSQVQTTNLSSNEDAYLYKSIPSRTTGVIDVDVNRTSGANKVACIGVSANSLDDCHNTTSSAYLIWSWGGNFQGLLNGNTHSSNITGITAGTTYYVTITYDGSNVTYAVYSDSARTSLLSSQTQAYTSSFNYLYAMSSYNDGSGATLNDTISNFHLRQYASTQPSVSAASEENSLGPVAYWKFDEGQGSIANDSAKSGKNGSLSGTPDWKPESECISGKCLFFDGTNNDRVQVTDSGNNDPLDFGTGSFTVSFWGKPLDYTYPKALFPILDGNTAYQDGSGHEGWSIADNFQSTGVNISFNDGTHRVSDTISFNSGMQPNDLLNKWTQFTYVFNRTTNRITAYINGTQQIDTIDISPVTGSVSNTAALSIGYGSGWKTQGYLDEFKIYPYALNTVQVKADYTSKGTSGGATATLGADPSQNSSLSNGLVGYWKMDEQSGAGSTLADSSGNGNAATVQLWGGGNTATDSAHVTGKFGNGFNFDGGDDRLNMGTASLYDFTTTDFTLSTWVKQNDAGNNKTLFFKGNPYCDACTPGYGVYVNAGIPKFTINPTTTAGDLVNITATTNINGTQWHLLTAQRSGNTFSLYVDGKLEGSTTTSSAITINDTSTTLAFSHAVYAYNGLTDELRIYSRALSPAEITQLYNWAPGPVGYWKLDENTGSIVSDQSGNGLNGTFSTVAPTWSSGKYGSALNFATNTYVKIPLGGFVSTLDTGVSNNSFSYSVFFKPTAIGGTQYLLTDNEPCNNPGDFSIGLNAGNVVFKYRSTAGVANVTHTFTPSTALQNNQWYHLEWVKTFGQLGVKAYLNGVPQTVSGDSNLVGYTSNLPNLLLGTWNGDGATCTTGVTAIPPVTSSPFLGSIDDVKIYNYARTANQVTEDMNAGHPLGGSPIGSQLLYWKFDENTATTAHDSVGNYTGTLACGGTSCINPSWKNDGKINGALYFSSSTGMRGAMVTAPSVNMGSTVGDSLTVTMWVKPVSTETNYGWLLRNGHSNDENYSIKLVNLTGGKYAVGTEYNSDSTFRNLNGTQKVVPQDQWSHLAVVFTNGVNMKIYLNGTYVETVNWTGSPSVASTTDFNIGGHNGTTNQFFGGYIDDVKVYSSALSADEVKIDMNANAAIDYGSTSKEASTLDDGAGNPPVAYWDLEERSGSTAKSKTATADDATWHGTLGSQWSTGKNGAAANFNGTNNYLQATTPTGLNTSGFTAQGWIYTRTQPGYYSSTVLSIGNGFILYRTQGGTGKIGAQIYNGSAWTTINSSGCASSETMNAWHMYSLTYNATTSQGALSLDGASCGAATTVSSGLNAAYSSTLYMGYYSSYFHDGKLDDVKIYDYVRTPAQVAYDYNRGAPLVWWKYDDCQGAIAHDSSGNGYHGNIVIGATVPYSSVGSCSSGTSTEAWNAGTTGKFNTGIGLDGVDDYITTNVVVPGANGSVMFWVKNPAAGAGSYLFRSNANSRTYISIGSNISFTKGNPGVSVGSTPSIPSNTWVHVALTWWTDSGGTQYARSYYNGLPIAAAVTFLDSNNGSYVVQGAFSNTGVQNSSGIFDDLQVYNYALSPTQVKDVMNESSAMRFGPLTGSP